MMKTISSCNGELYQLSDGCKIKFELLPFVDLVNTGYEELPNLGQSAPVSLDEDLKIPLHLLAEYDYIKSLI